MIAAAALASLLVAAEPCGLPALRPGPLPWRAGEVLQFDLDVMGNGGRPGTLALEAGRPMFGGHADPAQGAGEEHLGVRQDPAAFAGAAFSWVDARTLLPERYREEADENGVHKVSDARLSPPGPTHRFGLRLGRKAGGAAPVPARGDGARRRLGGVLPAARAAKLSAGDRFCFDLVGQPPLLAVPRQGGGEARARRLRPCWPLRHAARRRRRFQRADKPGAKRPAPPAGFPPIPGRVLVGAVSEIDLGPASALLSKPP